MNEKAELLAVLFADICDSTRLYQSLGDAGAHDLVLASLRLMTGIAERHGATLVRGSGDGVMCALPSAPQALLAALAMQDGHRGGPIHIRVGINSGPVIPSEGDIYGDAVNLAARVSAAARAGEVLLTRSVAEALPDTLRDLVSFLDAMVFKGIKDPVHVFRIEPDGEDEITLMRTKPFDTTLAPDRCLILSHGGREISIAPGAPPLSIGRDPGCGLIVPGTFASRRHALVEIRGNRSTITDQSTNGTFVVAGDGAVYSLKRDTLTLYGSGIISLGARIGPDTPDLIRFRHVGPE
jgi:class 3 adenylate cyclase